VSNEQRKGTKAIKGSCGMGKEKISKYTPMANEDERYYEFYERVAILLGEIENPTEKQVAFAEKIAKRELLERGKNGSNISNRPRE